MTDVTRQEHLQWCKDRALAFLDQSPPDLANAFASISSDLGKHPKTKGHAGIMLGVMLTMGGHLDTCEEMRKHIEGFN